MARTIFALRLHNCFPNARAIIGAYGGSTALLAPLSAAG